MGILKLIKIIFVFLFITTACRNPKIKKYDYQHEIINLKRWDINKLPIDKGILFCYKKNTNFNLLEKRNNLSKTLDYLKEHNMTSLKFESLPIIDLNKDYKLILNDTITYNIKNIKTDKIVDKYGFRRVDTIYNMIKSMNINGKDYQFDRPRVFSIPKDAYIIEK